MLVRDEERKQAFEAIKANTIKGIETRIPQPVPPGTGEAAYPGMEHDMTVFPARTFSSRRWTARIIPMAWAWTSAAIPSMTRVIA